MYRNTSQGFYFETCAGTCGWLSLCSTQKSNIGPVFGWTSNLKHILDKPSLMYLVGLSWAFMRNMLGECLYLRIFICTPPPSMTVVSVQQLPLPPLFHPQHCLFSLVLISFWHFPISQLIWLYMQALMWSGAELIFCLISGECMALALLSLTEEKISVCGQDVHGIVWDYKKKEQGDKRGGAGKGGITYTRLRDRWKYSCVCFWHREKEMWEERKCHGWKY